MEMQATKDWWDQQDGMEFQNMFHSIRSSLCVSLHAGKIICTRGKSACLQSCCRKLQKAFLVELVRLYYQATGHYGGVQHFATITYPTVVHHGARLKLVAHG